MYISAYHRRTSFYSLELFLSSNLFENTFDLRSKYFTSREETVEMNLDDEWKFEKNFFLEFPKDCPDRIFETNIPSAR